MNTCALVVGSEQFIIKFLSQLREVFDGTVVVSNDVDRVIQLQEYQQTDLLILQASFEGNSIFVVWLSNKLN